MAVYKIFPEKDNTLYSSNPLTNAGLDSILEISNENFPLGSEEVSRILIQFPQEIIEEIVSKINGEYKVFIKTYIANSLGLPDKYTIYANPISGSWSEGVGRYLYNPSYTEGSNWVNRNTGETWETSNYDIGVTGSFISNNPGGSCWYSLYQASQSFNINEVKDIEMDVTNIISQFVSGNIDNNGIVLRIENQYEFNSASLFSLKYFSKDTHTIYPPQLEIRWDDSSYSTGSLKGFLGTEPTITLGNNKGIYNQGEVCKFKINARDKYPPRQFVTESVYNINKALPSSSYWALRDFDTGEYVIDFDENYTKVSCDSVSNYFVLNMGGLQAERYYEIVIKSSFDNENINIFEGKFIFKINK